MTEHRPIKAATRDPSIEAMARAMEAAIVAAERHPSGRDALGQMLCVALDTVAGGAPLHTAFGDMRSDAEWWADCATPVELELYAAAALRRIERKTFAPRARKRLFKALWRTFTADERAAFLAAVKDRPP